MVPDRGDGWPRCPSEAQAPQSHPDGCGVTLTKWSTEPAVVALAWCVQPGATTKMINPRRGASAYFRFGSLHSACVRPPLPTFNSEHLGQLDLMHRMRKCMEIGRPPARPPSERKTGPKPLGKGASGTKEKHRRCLKSLNPTLRLKNKKRPDWAPPRALLRARELPSLEQSWKWMGTTVCRGRKRSPKGVKGHPPNHDPSRERH